MKRGLMTDFMRAVRAIGTAPGKRETLRKHLLLRLIGTLMATFLLSVLVIVAWIRPNVTRVQMDRNQWHAYCIAQALDSHMGQYVDAMRTTAIMMDVLRLSHRDLDADEFRSMLRRIVQDDTAFENLMILDLEGTIVHAPQGRFPGEGLDLSRSSWFVPDMPEDQIVWSAVQYSAFTSHPSAVCVLRRGSYLYVGFVRLQAIDAMVHRMQMTEGTHVHVFDQKNVTVVGHAMEEAFTRSIAPHLPEDGFAEEHGDYNVFDGMETYYAEYYRLPESGWVVSVMTARTVVWKTVWLYIGDAFGMLVLLGVAMLLLVWRSNHTWMKEFAAIERLLHRIALPDEATDSADLTESAPTTIMAVAGRQTPGEPALRFTDFDSLIRDFTQLMDTAHISEEEAREKAVEAEQANQAKNRFLANISQEIRNPLGGILGASDLLLFRETDPEKRERLRLLRQSAEVLRHTMDDVLEIANMEGGRFIMEDDEIQIHRLLEDLVLQFANAADKKGLELGLRWDRTLPQWVRGDGMRIRQILSNLVENALKFTEEGVVRITSQLESMEGDQVRVRFSVRDTGIGIPSDDREKVFWEFHQVVNSNGTGRVRGIGLGLAVCRRLVDAMGGEIGVESEVGQGSLFWVVLPLRRSLKETEVADGRA